MPRKTLEYKVFTERTPSGKKIKVKRFYYELDDMWACAECFHVGANEIIATIPCSRCSQGLTQSFVEKEEINNA